MGVASESFRTKIAGSYSIEADGHGGFENPFILTVTISEAQIVPTGLKFTPDGGVDFGYTISGADLPKATTVALYWASGTTTDTVIGGPIASATTVTGQGTNSSTSPGPNSGRRQREQSTCSWSLTR